MKNRILVSGLLNIETTVKVKGFPINYYPIDYPFFGVNSNVSGVGCNIAKALTALGDNVTLVSFLGSDDEGDRVMLDLQRSSIPTDNIRRSLSKTPTSVVLFDPEGRRQVYCDLKDIQDQTISPETLDSALDSVSIAALCNINFNRELIKYARSKGVVTATDVHVLGNIEDNYNRDFMENADILFLSDEALPCPADEFVLKLRDRYHNKIIVIGMGAKGALLLEEDSSSARMIPAYCGGKPVNTVGAGDSLFSAFIHYYSKGFGAEDSLKRAVIFAGIKICSNGASVGFSEENKIEEIIGGVN